MTQVNRRDFLEVLAAVSLSPFVHISPVEQREAAALARMRKVYLQTVPIAGLYYYDGMEENVFDELATGDELELRREPANPLHAVLDGVFGYSLLVRLYPMKEGF